jgi:TRAP-type uncharacterized transport system substrate-binding protein
MQQTRSELIDLKTHYSRWTSWLAVIRDRGLAISVGVLLAIGLALALAVYAFIDMTAPTTLTITSGPPGSSFQRNAQRYKDILARNGVTLNILTSEGSPENLARLMSAKSKVDIGFVLGGELKDGKANALMTLGSISHQPLLIFYQGKVRHLLSEFQGARLDIGAEGTGTRTLALALLKANGIEPKGESSFVEVDAKDPEQALKAKRIDAIFLMGDSASSDLLRALLHAPEVHLFDVSQADAYVRRIGYLNKLVLPKGSLDFGKNIPEEDLNLIAPAVELVARDTLHPALSDLLLEAAHEVHGGAGLFRKSGEFPAPLEHEFRLSPDAARYYSSGKSFLYRTFPFWLASLIARALAVLVPLTLVLLPALKIAPVIYRWRIESRIYRWYKVLLDLERDVFAAQSSHSPADLLRQLDHIEASVNRIVVPASFGDMFYGLRGHVALVRSRLLTEPPEPATQTR